MIEVLEKLNEAAHTAWPFTEDSLLVGTYSGSERELPRSFLLDCRATIYSEGRGKLRLASAIIPGSLPTRVSLSIIYEPEIGSDIGVTVLNIPADSEWDTMPVYRVSLQWPSLIGIQMSLRLVLGPGVRDFCSGENGKTYIFDDLYFEPSCIRPADFHLVRSFQSNTGVGLTGDVKFMDGYNTSASVLTGGNIVKLNAGVGAGLGIPCEQMFPQPSNCADLVYMINGVTPTWRGEMLLVPGAGMELTPDPDNHRLVLKTSMLTCPGCRDEGAVPPQPPAPAQGACVLAGGTCISVTEAVCGALGGTYLGDGEPCPGPAQRGACVVEGSGCFDVTEADCVAMDGDYQGDGSDCPDPTGGCCLPDGSCSSMTEAACESEGGTYKGDYVPCVDEADDIFTAKAGLTITGTNLTHAARALDKCSCTYAYGDTSASTMTLKVEVPLGSADIVTGFWLVCGLVSSSGSPAMPVRFQVVLSGYLDGVWKGCAISDILEMDCGGGEVRKSLHFTAWDQGGGELLPGVTCTMPFYEPLPLVNRWDFVIYRDPDYVPGAPWPVFKIFSCRGEY